MVLILKFYLQAQVRKHNKMFSITPTYLSFANKIKRKRNYYHGSNYSCSLLARNLLEESGQVREDTFAEDAKRLGFL